jgi:hypothetical protein
MGIVIDKHVTVTMRDAPSCRPTSTAPTPVAPHASSFQVARGCLFRSQPMTRRQAVAG